MRNMILMTLAGVLLTAPVSAKPSPLERKNCKSSLVRSHLRDARSSSLEILRKGTTPGLHAEDLAEDLTTHLHAVASVIGLCSTDRMLSRLGLLGQKVPMTTQSAPALALEALVGSPIITGRYQGKAQAGALADAHTHSQGGGR